MKGFKGDFERCAALQCNTKRSQHRIREREREGERERERVDSTCYATDNGESRTVCTLSTSVLLYSPPHYFLSYPTPLIFLVAEAKSTLLIRNPPPHLRPHDRPAAQPFSPPQVCLAHLQNVLVAAHVTMLMYWHLQMSPHAVCSIIMLPSHSIPCRTTGMLSDNMTWQGEGLPFYPVLALLQSLGPTN